MDIHSIYEIQKGYSYFATLLLFNLYNRNISKSVAFIIYSSITFVMMIYLLFLISPADSILDLETAKGKLN